MRIQDEGENHTLNCVPNFIESEDNIQKKVKFKNNGMRTKNESLQLSSNNKLKSLPIKLHDTQ